MKSTLSWYTRQKNGRYGNVELEEMSDFLARIRSLAFKEYLKEAWYRRWFTPEKVGERVGDRMVNELDAYFRARLAENQNR